MRWCDAGASEEEGIMSGASHTEEWTTGGSYEAYVGRWSRLVAREFLTWLAVPQGRCWLDVGCGTGALGQPILDMASPKGLVGIDPSLGYIADATERVSDSRARFVAGDARRLPCKTATFDAVVSGLVINFVPEPQVAVAEMTRAARPGGAVAAYVWDYAGKIQLMRCFWDAAVALDPSASEQDEGRRFPICSPGPLAQLFRDAGLRTVEVRAIDVATDFRDFDDYWSPFLGRQGPAPGYAMSLSEEHRSELRERIRAHLPIAPDGSIHLVGRAWAVRGER
jgi:SAM-dependent methyltransferase